MKAKFIYEALSDVFKPKDLADAIKEMDFHQKIEFYYMNLNYVEGDRDFHI